MRYQRGGRIRNSFNRRAAQPPTTVSVDPTQLVPFALFSHSCQEALVCKAQTPDVPYFNARIYLADGTNIGQVDEIFGALHEFYVSVRLHDPLQVRRFSVGSVFYVDAQKLLPLARFTTRETTRNKIIPKTKHEKQQYARQRPAQRSRGRGRSSRRGSRFGRGSKA